MNVREELKYRKFHILYDRSNIYCDGFCLLVCLFWLGLVLFVFLFVLFGVFRLVCFILFFERYKADLITVRKYERNIKILINMLLSI